MKLLAATAVLLTLSAAPALAMSCCGGGKGKAAMCGKSGMAKSGMSKSGMSKSGMSMSAKGPKKGCCCEGMGAGMGAGMSRRT